MLNSIVVDFVVVGGGIVGLATAYELTKRFPDCSLVLLEKEAQVALHQSGRNSGVLHSGIYYKPGSLKAQLCRQGKMAMEGFCSEQQIAWERCGKIIVAINQAEEQRLQAILERGRVNQIDCRLIDAKQIREIEPHAAGTSAIHVPEAGIVDYRSVCNRLRTLIIDAGHQVLCGQRVHSIQQGQDNLLVTTEQGEKISSGRLVSCGGLYSDRIARLAGLIPPAQIVPFRGEYFELLPEYRQLCKNLIYPVPDPSFPFLGVHFTRMIDGQVECGPNAVLALAREGYDWKSISLGELWQSLRYRGFQKIAMKHWQVGLGEIRRSLSKTAFVAALKRLIPELQAGYLRRYRSGVRAQAIAPDGTMVDDFLWVTQGRSLHLCNAPSPAATASLAIARQIVDQLVRLE